MEQCWPRTVIHGHWDGFQIPLDSTALPFIQQLGLHSRLTLPVGASLEGRGSCDCPSTCHNKEGVHEPNPGTWRENHHVPRNQQGHVINSKLLRSHLTRQKNEIMQDGSQKDNFIRMKLKPKRRHHQEAEGDPVGEQEKNSSSLLFSTTRLCHSLM